MIIVKLAGGLGNQMFQYAAGRALALKHKVGLKFDTSFLERDPGLLYTARRLELTKFKTQFEAASPGEIEALRLRGRGTFKKGINFLFPFLSKSMNFSERGHSFQWQFKYLPEDTYLDGFWQSEKYFRSVRPVLLSEFTPLQISNEMNFMLRKIQSEESVGLHVRRGDYVTLASARDFHGVCSPGYYNDAIKLIVHKKPSIKKVWVFSDDIEWCRINLNTGIDTDFVEGFRSHEDLYLMSCCSHQVIANSSFSWWAAWLNKNIDKMVVMPEYWFAGIRSVDTGIVPENWIVK